MGVLPVIQQGKDSSVCLTIDDLPEFYMSDFSILGLKVINLDRTFRVLTEREFSVNKKSEHLEIDIDSASQMSEIVTLLNQNGIDCGITDIVDQVYQG